MRFSVLSLLLLCGGFCALVAVCFAVPIVLANCVMAMATLTLPAVFLGGALSAPNNQKAFFLGALIPFAFYLFRDSGAEFHVGQQVMVSLYSRFKGAPDPLAPAIESAYFLTQGAVVVASIVAGVLCAVTSAAYSKRRDR